MLWNGRLKAATSVVVLAAMVLQPFAGWAGTSETAATTAAAVQVKMTPSTVSADSSQLPPDRAAAEDAAVQRLFDNDTTTVYAPGQPARVTVTLAAPASIGSLRLFGSSSYKLNVYRDNSGAWEPVPSLSGKGLTDLTGNAWNTLSADAPVSAKRLLLEFIPQGDAGVGVPEVEFWGSISSPTADDVPRATLANLKTPRQALDLLAKGLPHIFSVAATPTEIAVPDGSTGDSSSSVSFTLAQNPSTLKRAYLLYDGYNIVRPVSVGKRINGGSWSGGYVIAQPEGSAPSWTAQLEEINPAWLVPGENRVEFRSPSGTAAVRNLTLVIETDSGWNSVASVSAPAVYDGDPSTSYAIHASGDNPSLQVSFERTVAPRAMRLHVDGPVNLAASLQFLSGGTWQEVKPGWKADLSTLKAGWNEIELPAQVAADALRLVFETRSLRLKGGVQSGAINEIRVAASPVGTLSGRPQVVVSYPRDGEYFGRTAYIQGFATPVSSAAGNVEVTVGGKASPATGGAFSVSLSKDETGYADDPDDTAWTAALTSSYGGGSGAVETLTLDRNAASGALPEAKVESRSNAGNGLLGESRVKYSEKVSPGQAKKISHEGVELDIPEGAVETDTEITIIPLTQADLAGLDPGMVNVTSPAAGYRFLPHGMKFKKPIRISFGYAKKLIPAGQTANDVGMFYYDESQLKWQPLSRVSVDAENAQVVSESNHFTDIINTTLVVPEHPQALSFNPNSIKEIKAADPTANVELIEPPKANNRGSADLSYPIDIPPGRNRLQPDIALRYNSSGGNGWMGVGWEIPAPAISIDTRWGVPRYDAESETETYTLDGEELAPVAHRGEPVPRTQGTSTLADGERVKIFHPRVEGRFRKIIRHGTSPRNYWWEVIDKNGTRYFYGGKPDLSGVPNGDATLADPASGSIFKWALRQIRDTNGNTVNYGYTLSGNTGISGGSVPGYQLYPSRIDYTGHDDVPGAYSVIFTRDRDLPNFVQRPDVAIDARAGFKTVTADLLRKVEVYLGGSYQNGTMTGGSLVRSYELRYNENAYGDNRPGTAFNKTLLTSVSQYGKDGGLFNTHRFTYYDEARNGDGSYRGFEAAKDWTLESDVTAGLFGKGAPSALGGISGSGWGGAVYVGIGPPGKVTSKDLTAGPKIGYNSSSSEGVVAMVDVDGDGLPDKVFKGGDGYYYRRNLSGPHGGTAFGAPARLSGLKGISREKVTTTTLGTEAYAFGASVLNDTNKGVSTSDTYLSDVNGDGLIDLVTGGRVLFGHLDAGGVPTFSANSADTPVAIAGGTIDTTGLLEDPGADEAERAVNFPLMDTLRRWVAPYDGTVRIDAPVQLVRVSGDKRDSYDGADGVQVAIQLEGAELWSMRTLAVPDFRAPTSPRILADDYTTHTPTGVDNVQVKKGDRIYFRVQSVFDGAYDRLSWDPQITYLNADTSVTDVNSLPVYRYRASEGFTLAGRNGTVSLPLAGTLHLGGTWTKSGATTDDVTLVVTLNGSEVYRRTLASAETAAVELSQDLAVARNDALRYSILVDSPIDAGRVQFVPTAYYTNAEGVDEVKDDQGNYVIKVSPPYDMDLYAADGLAAPQESWKAAETGNLTVVPTLQATGTAVPTQQVAFTVKKRGSLLGKGFITFSQGSDGTPVQSPLALTVPVTAGDELFFDFSTRDAGLASRLGTRSVQVSYQTTPAPYTVASAVHTPVAEGAFPEPFRGWGAVGYNGNAPRDAQPIDQSLLAIDDSYDPKKGSVYPFAPLPGDSAWGGVDDGAWVKGAEASSSRLGLDDIRMPHAEDFAGASAPSRISKSTTHSLSGGVGGGGISGGVGGGSGDSSSKVDFQDLNGDRFPDVVGQGGVQYTRPTGTLDAKARDAGLGAARSSSNETYNMSLSGTIALAIGNSGGSVAPAGGHGAAGASQGSDMPPIGIGGDMGFGTSDTDYDLIDVNGDGLPDKVYKDGTVSLNLGYRFQAQREPWGGGVINKGETRNTGINMGFNSGDYSYGGGMNLGTGSTWSHETYVDVNGDGLPDKLSDGKSMTVRLNTGAGFSDPVPWPGGQDKVALDKHISLGGGVYFTFGFQIWLIRIVINPGASYTKTMGRPEYAFRDMDGDGFEDHVFSDRDGKLSVARNQVGRTNLLKSVKRPLGGSIGLEYAREGNSYEMPQSQWLMTAATLSDGAGRSYRTTYAYAEPHQDRYNREFYGFRTLSETHAPGSAAERTVTETFHTKELGDEEDFYQKGLLLKSVTSDRYGRVWAATANTYTPTPVHEANAAVAYARFPALTRTDTYFYDGTVGESGFRKSTFQSFAYDDFGNVTTFFDAGELADAADDLTATIGYWRDPQQYIMKPDTIAVKDSARKVLRKRWASYENGTGNLMSHTSLATGGQSPVWQFGYDPYGNIKTVIDPVGYKLTYGYDAETNSYVTRVEDNFSSRDGGPYYSTAGYDLRFGLPAWTKDLNGNYQVSKYDEFGRLASVFGPYDTDASGNPLGLATLAFDYKAPVFGEDGETLAAPAGAVTHNKASSRVGSVGKTLDTVLFADGMKRVLQTKKEADVNGAYGMTVSGLVVYDELGRTVEQGQPLFQGGGDLYAYLPQQLPKNPTRFGYDALDRTVRVETPDAQGRSGYAVTTTAYGFGKTGSTGLLYATAKVVDPIGNAAGEANRKGTKLSFKDVDERIAAVVEYNNGSPITTSYDYDPLGQITGVRDNMGNATAVEYDLVGRRTAITNPDTGRTEYGYDANGNMTSKLSANYQRGKEIKYNYLFNRLTGINYPNSTGVAYEYGAMGTAYNRAGRIARVIDESGVEERYYGKLGETTREVKSVDAKTPSAQRKSYATDYVFDSFGRMLQMTYPDGENLYYAYDNGGLLKSAWGMKQGNRYNYVNALTYDEFGQRRHVDYGNGVSSEYGYDEYTRRLESLTTATPDGRTIQNLSYGYDLVGNVLRMENAIGTPTDTALPAGPAAQVLEYDDLYQLKTANGEYGFGPGKRNLYSNELNYDTIGNFTRKSQVNRILQPSATATLPKETNYLLDYRYGGTHPHAVTDAGDKLYSYDAAGNMTGWTGKTNGKQRSIIWNEENRVKEIADSGKSTYFLYDDAGERVLKRGQHGETFYINRFYSIKNGELGTKSIYAGNTRVASKLVKTPNTVTANTATSIPGIQGLDHGQGNKTGIITRLPDGTSTGILPPEEKDQYFYHGDHLGSSNMITDASGSVYQHLEYFPFGETWIDEGKTPTNIPGYQFTGKELDPETGLYYFGARYYEPVISRWISADPILGKYLPSGNKAKDENLPGMGGVFSGLNLALYSYVGDNPVKFVDPDGTDTNFPMLQCHVDTHNDVRENKWGAAIVGLPLLAVAAGPTLSGAALSSAVRFPKTAQFITHVIAGLAGAPTPTAIKTPYGPAAQSTSAQALKARELVKEGATLYRGGRIGASAGPEAQFWSLENPISSEYAERYGIPPENMNFNFIETGTLKKGAGFITREAPGVGPNGGGAIEVVVNPNSVQLKSFTMPQGEK